MSRMITGSICLTDLIDNAKKQHSAFSKSQKNGKIYCNIMVWENDEPDQYGNEFSIKLNSSKEKRDAEKAANNGKDIYVGHMKVQSKGGEKPLEASDAAALASVDDLPF